MRVRPNIIIDQRALLKKTNRLDHILVIISLLTPEIRIKKTGKHD
jgi:hypothetical protein